MTHTHIQACLQSDVPGCALPVTTIHPPNILKTITTYCAACVGSNAYLQTIGIYIGIYKICLGPQIRENII